MEDRKTVVFGLDGACLDLVQPWIDDGSLPTLEGLIEQGGASELESCIPATTPPAWTSLTTGMNPGKHGVFGFYGRQRGTYDIEPVTDADVYARRLWDYTTERDLTSLIVNVPVTHPGREINGVIVPGYLAGDTPETYPADILERVGMDDYRVYAPSEGSEGKSDGLLEEWLELTDSRSTLTRRLMESYDWDLLFLEFQKTDGAMHKFDDREKVKQIFERVDDCMRDVLAEVPGKANVFVVSDHGIGQEKDWAVALNTWLQEEGYLSTTMEGRRNVDWIDEATGNRSESPDQEDKEKNRGWSWGRVSIPERMLAAAQRAGITVQQIERVLTRVGLYDLATKVAPEGTADALEEEVVDRPRSTAFYEGMGFSGVDVGVVINDEAFYQDGTVSAGEYEAVREELVNAFERMSGPDGRPFEQVHEREDVYHGPRTEYAPDIVLEQADRYVIGSQYPRGKTYIPADAGRIDHRRHGLLVAAGPDVTPDWSLPATPSIFDVTPTLVHLLDGSLNQRFDGEILDLILRVDRNPTWRKYDPYEPEAETELTDDEEAELRDRLQGMGYLE